MTKLIVVRHGESESNSLGVMGGHTDFALTDLGLEQAKETAAHEGQTVLVASHGAVIRAFWALIANIPFDEVKEKLRYPSN